MANLGPFELDTIVVGDCLGVMRQMPDGCVNLIFCDWPYNIRKATWDNGFDWRPVIPEVVRVLQSNGALWVIHGDPLELADVSKAIVKASGPPLINWVTWDKYNGAVSSKGFMDGYTLVDSLRSFQQMCEYLIYHADDGQWQAQTDKVRGFIFEPLREYLADEWARAGLRFEQANEACGTASMAAKHYFARSQWCLPTAEHYENLRRYANIHGTKYHGNEYLRQEYEYLRREYEDMRREYEYLRPVFNNPGLVSSVWPGPPAARNEHETPKPEWLLERIIKTTTNEGDLIFDPFIGSGTTAVAAKKLGRDFFGCDINPGYVEIARRRLAQVQERLL